MAKEETPSVSEDLQNLQRKMSLLIKSFQNNSKVVAFTKSPVGQYLDRHPFLALSTLVFMALSAVPVGLFGLVVVLSSLAALVGVLLLEGLVISVGGITLLCVLCGLVFISLALSGAIIMSYVVVSSLINYWFSSRVLCVSQNPPPACEPCSDRPPAKQNPSVDCQLAVKSAVVKGLHQE